MNTHKNARLTYARRLEMVQDIIERGRSLAEAVVRARYLEERCLVGEGLKARDGWRAVELNPRSRWFEKETTRAWAWLRWRYGGDS